MEGPILRPILEVRDLELRYGEVTAVDRLSLEVPRGSLTALLGPSGCGKTSLLRAVAGFEVPASGTICIEGRTVAAPGIWVSPEERKVGMVFQQGALFPHLTVWKNVLYGVKGRHDARERARETLRLVGLEGLEGRYPDELSGGQQQRVALARALAPSPKLVLLDEPFASLDAGLRERLREEVREILQRAGMTALLVTHDQEEALSIADQVAVMSRGRILQVGAPEEIYQRPASPEVARFVGDGQLLECRIAGGVAQSLFGEVPCQGPEGRGFLLVRPEDLVELPEETRHGLPGRVVARRFYGHDLVDEVLLDSGETVRVRSFTPVHRLAVGSRIRVALRQRRLPIFASEEAVGFDSPVAAGAARDPGEKGT